MNNNRLELLAPLSAPEPVCARGTSADERVGVSALPGLAVGKIVQYRQQALDVAEQGAGLG